MSEIIPNKSNGNQESSVSREAPSNIVEPYLATFIAMDDISRKLTQLLKQNNDNTIKLLSQNRDNNTQIINNHTQIIKEFRDNHIQTLKESRDNHVQILKESGDNHQQLLKQIKENQVQLLKDGNEKNAQIIGAFTKLLEVTHDNQKLLGSILGELQADADAGEFLRTSGTVTPNRFVIIDTMVAPGHMVKGYTVKNGGPNNIFVAHNAAISSEVDADIIDVTGTVSRFEIVEPNEDIKFVFNRKKIRNVHILAQGGNSSFRAWLVW